LWGYFEINGRKAPAPLQFGIPEEDINCRCICLVKPRWDVDSAFTKIDNETGQLLEFQGVEDYEDLGRGTGNLLTNRRKVI